MRRFLVLFVVLVIGVYLAMPNKAHCYSYGAWVGMTGANTLALNPFLSGNLGNGTPATFTDWDMLLEFGFGDKADIFYSFSSSWGMIRYDFSGKNLAIAALMISSSSVGLQYHAIYDELDKFAIEGNVYFDFPYETNFGESMTIGAIIAPVLKLGAINIFVEFDPAYTLAGGGAFSLGIVPGVCFNIGDSQLSIGIPLGDVASGSLSVGYGAWLWVPFSFVGKEKPASTDS